MAYNALVRPQLEYAMPVWDPHTNDKITQIEKLQKRAARWTCNNFVKYASVSEMVNNFGWSSLEPRCADSCLCLFYKVVHGLVAVPFPTMFNWIFESLDTPMSWPLDNCKLPGIITTIPFFHRQQSSGMPYQNRLSACRVLMPSTCSRL